MAKGNSDDEVEARSRAIREELRAHGLLPEEPATPPPPAQPAAAPPRRPLPTAPGRIDGRASAARFLAGYLMPAILVLGCILAMLVFGSPR